jgi:hypothetical protein
MAQVVEQIRTNPKQPVNIVSRALLNTWREQTTTGQ